MQKSFFKTHFIFRWIKLNAKSLFAQMQMHTTVKSNLAKNIGTGHFYEMLKFMVFLLWFYNCEKLDLFNAKFVSK